MDNVIETTPLSKTLVLKFRIILRDAAGEVVKTRNTRKQGRTHTFAKKYEWASAELRVQYGENGPTNEGVYSNLEELQAAITAFTEPELIRYLTGQEN